MTGTATMTTSSTQGGWARGALALTIAAGLVTPRVAMAAGGSQRTSTAARGNAAERNAAEGNAVERNAAGDDATKSNATERNVAAGNTAEGNAEGDDATKSDAATDDAPAPETPTAVLDVDVELGESDDEIVGKRLHTEAIAALAERDVEVVEGAAPSKVDVEVRWDADENHAITVRVTNRGEPTATVEGSPFICDACGENELITKIREVVPECIPLLPELETNGSTVDGPHDGTDPGDDKEGDYAKIGAAGIAGIVVLAGGIGLTAFGGVELAKGQETDRSDPQFPTVDDHRPRGIAFVAAGGTAVIAGAVLLAIDLTVLKNRRKRRAARVAPLLTPRVVGLGVSGRF